MRTGRSRALWRLGPASWLAAAAFAFVLSVAAQAEAACGDGILDGSETCDDGATTSGDGCSNFCQREAGFVCTGAPSLCCFADAAAAYALSGNASFNTTTGEVVLTPDAFNNRGYAWFKRRISFATDFSVAVKLYLGTHDSDGADGGSIMFQRHPDGTAAVGSLGDMLGANFSPLIAVEFDTWNNTSTFGDIAQDHVSIFRTAPNPASNQLATAVCMDNACSNFEDGRYHSYRVDWTAATKTMVVTIDGSVRRTLVYDVVANVFAGDPNNIVFGFAAVTGAAANLQKFCPAAPAGYSVPRDSDGDGVDDALDADDDNDGILDTQETESLFGAIDPSGDSDQDGIPNYDDPGFWASIGRAAECPDTVAPIGDCDTVPTVIDADADGTPNHLDLDSDNDNTKDVIEAGGTDVNNDGKRDGCTPVQSNGACQGAPLVPGDVDGDNIPNTRDTDSDNDGDLDGADCAPLNAAIYHGATEGAGDGIDANCDGQELCFDDDDGDGFLDSSGDTRVSSDLDCLDANEGSTSMPTTDCDDSAPGIKPGATEFIGDNIDGDCNGQELCFDDDDGDGFLDNSGDIRTSSDTDCNDANEGTTSMPMTDCNDSAAGINPGVAEICDGANIDEDCDALSDDADASATGKSMFFTDADGDSFGAAASMVLRCDPLAGQVTNGLDCNDGASAINPSATEICDAANVDEDCDGLGDDADPSVSAAGKITFFRDQDGDGFGMSALSTSACDPPSGYVASSTDCDDTSNTRYPGANEVCDAIDQDCDGDRVEAFSNIDGDALPDCSDADDDNDGDPDVTDCNDTNATVYTGAPDNTCNGLDNDCDGTVDEDGPPQNAACRGLDADGDGIPNNDECANPSDCQDTDGDGTPDFEDLDSDGDALNDADECTSSPCEDTDQDGLPDALERSDRDSDADGTNDDLDDDSDGDGIDDGTECPNGVCADTDGDGIPDVLDADDGGPGPGDSDGDGITDDLECTALPCVDTDGDLVPDYADTDADGDGDPDQSDCARTNAGLSGNATEIVADGIDQDCDGGDTCYDDADDDGFLTSTPATRSSSDLDCTDANEGSATDPRTDCNDSVASIKPGATEVVGNGVDDDCNGQELCFDDDDGDGFLDASGDTRTSSDADCSDPNEGSTSTPTTDCNDAAAAVNPSAIEVCDGANIDEDCDTLSDDADPSATGKSAFFTDADGDSFGAAASMALRCDPLAGQVTNGNDCNDGASGVNPSAPEICDGANVDEDCDGLSDDADSSVSAAGKSTFFRDLDGDGFGASAMSVAACDTPSGYVASSTDCDDTSSTRFPGATELCDAIDQDCDGDFVESFSNFDADSFPDCSDEDDDNDGDLDATDCNDANPAVRVGAADDTCNGVDDDCDGAVDEDGPTQDPACRGLDADGDGIPNAEECTDPSDCQDTDGDGTPDFEDLDSDGDALNDADECTSSPCEDMDQDGLSDALERSDRDSDADGTNDDRDDDSDGDGVDDGTECPNGVCDDTDGDGIPDVLDADDGGPGPGDSDGDGITDDLECTALPCVDTDGDLVPDYADTDADGDGDPDQSDCARTNAGLGAGESEIVADGIDQDCDGGDTCYDDADDDGFLASTPATRVSSDLDCTDANEGSATDPRTDCNDGESGVNPAATEVCDANDIDEDCDQRSDDADDSVADQGKTTFHRDQDSDGFGALAQALAACDAPAGYVTNATDCDDAAALVNPAAVEVCDPNDVDENCDGARDDASALGQTPFYRDQDGDGFGALADASQACNPPTGYVADATDCDDTSSSVNPAASELCDGENRDEDCDGLADDLDTGALGAVTFYRDQDGDGFGTITAPLAACDLPPGYVLDSTDCEDTLASVNSSAVEVCDAIDVDEDCDGAADDLDAMAEGRSAFYLDADGDGFGLATVTTQACDRPSGYVTDATDCDDQRASSFPGATELCDAFDQDCDGSLVGSFPNLDGDAFPDCSDDDDDGDGDPDATDCDDANPAVHAGAADDTCNGVDDDCDGARDQDGPPEQAECVELDADGDGIPNGTECADPNACADNDSDGTPDFQDDDSDGDGAPDRDECGPDLPCADADGDGLSDQLERRDRDSDDDGVPDQEDTDSDGDGIDDSVECDEGRCGDEDGDGIPDQLDRAGDATGPGDSDDDGLPDDLECPSQPCADSDNDGTPDYVELDADGDGALDRDDPAPTDACTPSDAVRACQRGDADGDGVTNEDECPDPARCTDSDGDGAPDFQDDDADGDGRFDRDESAATRLDPCQPSANVRACASGDADGDGVDNASECPQANSCPDTDGDGSPDFEDADADGDGLPDRDDAMRSDACVPSENAAACGRGDADGDGLTNAVECQNGRSCADSDLDGTPDYLDGDADGDAVDDRLDAAPRDPCRPYLNSVACPRGDADGDGVLNPADTAAEDGCLPDPRARSCVTSDNDGDGLVNAFDSAPDDPCLPTTDALACATGDADGDGLPNAVECPGARNCSDGDGDGSPDYDDDDSDGDGIDDAVECPDPRACVDGDGDGTPDWREAAEPMSDLDGDGVIDATECGPEGCIDTDGDGTVDRDDEDDDGDGIPTRDEVALGTALGIPIDLDGDGIPNYRDEDADGDGLLDREEASDLDEDGVPDYLQRTRIAASGGACRAAPDGSDASGLAWLLLGLIALVHRRRRMTRKHA